MRLLFFTLLWLGCVAYVFILSPPQQPDTFDLIFRLSTGAWDGLNPAIIALFNAMGLWPLAYACVALRDGQGQRWPAWPFVAASFAVGAFAILPYLALRQRNPMGAAPETPLLRLVDARWLGVLLAVGSGVLLGWGWLQGDWIDFWQQWQTDRFIHVMTLDFCLLWLLFPTLVPDDMARRHWHQSWVYAVLALPLVGACLYVILRPRLAEETLAAEVPNETKTVSF
jgi:hypothetical protein